MRLPNLFFSCFWRPVRARKVNRWNGGRLENQASRAARALRPAAVEAAARVITVLVGPTEARVRRAGPVRPAGLVGYEAATP